MFKMIFVPMDLTELSSTTKIGNFYFILLIYIVSILNIVYYMHVNVLFHLICNLIILNDFMLNSPVHSP